MMSRRFSVLDTGSAAVRCYFFNELRICLLLQNSLGGRESSVSQAGEALCTHPEETSNPTGHGWWLKNGQGQWILTEVTAGPLGEPGSSALFDSP